MIIDFAYHIVPIRNTCSRVEGNVRIYRQLNCTYTCVKSFVTIVGKELCFAFSLLTHPHRPSTLSRSSLINQFLSSIRTHSMGCDAFHSVSGRVAHVTIADIFFTFFCFCFLVRGYTWSCILRIKFSLSLSTNLTFVTLVFPPLRGMVWRHQYVPSAHQQIS